MKNKTLAWAVKWPDGDYHTELYRTKKQAQHCPWYKPPGTGIIRVEIKEVERKK